MKICSDCSVKMIKFSEGKDMGRVKLVRQFMCPDKTEPTLSVDSYFCPKCGIVLSYLSDETMQKLPDKQIESI